MKNFSIIYTDFVTDISYDLYLTIHNIGYTDVTITQEWLFDNIDLANELVNKNISRIHKELMELTDHTKLADLYDELDTECKLLINLGIISALKVPYYAHPEYISNAITTLSEKLTSELNNKSAEHNKYNKYYCSRLAECLKELCELIS